MNWNEERTELCVRLWNEGLSAGVIAMRLGGVTRNGIIGKIHRINDSKSSPYVITRRLVSRQRVAENKPTTRIRQPRADGRPRAAKVAREPLPPEPVKPDKLFKLADLEANQCRFPYGDPQKPGFGFCGCETTPGASYCPGHQHLCTTAPTVGVRKITWNWNDKKPAARVPGRRREGVHCA